MNKQAPRQFVIQPAVRARVPLLVGLVGPSSSGKTKSALRIADGIRSVFGGEHFVIDTEGRRALHYADQHQFQHVDFQPPYGSLDYLAAIEQCVKAGASVITVDSMSHEHESVGGMLDYQETELYRMAGDDYKKREACKFAAWIKPKRARLELLQGILRLNCNFIFCFRAREKVKPVKKDGKTEFVQLGYQPISGEEFLFEQAVNCLLLPGAGGVPTWQSDEIGEKALIKLPAYLQHCFEDRTPLDENTGAALAKWAKGEGAFDAVPKRVEVDQDAMEEIKRDLEQAASCGEESLKSTWMSLHKKHKNYLGRAYLEELKVIAAESDKEKDHGHAAAEEST